MYLINQLGNIPSLLLVNYYFNNSSNNYSIPPLNNSVYES